MIEGRNAQMNILGLSILLFANTVPVEWHEAVLPLRWLSSDIEMHSMASRYFGSLAERDRYGTRQLFLVHDRVILLVSAFSVVLRSSAPWNWLRPHARLVGLQYSAVGRRRG